MKFLYIDKANSVEDIRIAERTIWANEIPKIGHQVNFLLMAIKRNNDKTPRQNGVQVVPCSSNFLLSLLLFSIKLLILLYKNKPNYLVVRNLVDLGIISFLCAKLFGIKIIYIKAFPYLEFKIKSSKGISKYFLNLLLELEVLIINKADFLIIRTKEFKNELKLNYNINRDSLLVPMGIDTSFVMEMQRNQQCNIKNKFGCDNKVTGIYFGSIGKARRVDFLLDILKKVKIKYNNFNFIIIGGNQHEISLLERECERRELKVTLKTAIDRETLFYLIEACDFSVSPIPPIKEFILSSPTKVLESLGLGCPVIVNQEIIDQKNLVFNSKGGIIVDYSIDQFAHEILNILNYKYDLKTMGMNGKKYVFSERSYGIMAQNIIEYLKQKTTF